MREVPMSDKLMPGNSAPAREVQLDHGQMGTRTKRFPLVLLLDDVCLPENAGALFRMADAMGLEALYLCGKTVGPPNRKLHRVARHTDQVVTWHREESALALATSLRKNGYRLLCLELTSRSQPLPQLELDPGQAACLVVGNERHGVNSALLEQVGDSVHIPMRGQNSSMNVAMAAAIACYHITALQGDR
jgi:tRNA G18 (ribose-2'-O)-methylase SpoU